MHTRVFCLNRIIFYQLMIIACGFINYGCGGVPKFITPLSSTRITPDEKRFRDEWLETIVTVSSGEVKFLPCLVSGVRTGDAIAKIWNRYGNKFLIPEPNETKGIPLPNGRGYEVRSKDVMATILSYLVQEQPQFGINLFDNNFIRDKKIKEWAQKLISSGVIKPQT